jgi:5-methylcytosine-specific restriction endonuclease McrA
MTTPLPKTRKEALELGVTQYFTGASCKHGHLAPRKAGNGECTECARKVCRDHYKNNTAYHHAKTAAYRANHPEQVRAYDRAFYAERVDKKRHSELGRAWAEANAEKLRSYQRGYYSNHKETYYSRAAARRQRLAAQPATTEQRAEMLAIYKECRQRNADAGFVAFHVDHIIPLAKGGAHLPDNLQILPAEENLRKGAKLPVLI